MNSFGLGIALIKPATNYVASFGSRWLQFSTQRVVSAFRGSAIILTMVADVKIKRDRVELRPGMDGQVRFGQHQGARGAGGGELVKGLGDDQQPGVRAGASTQRDQQRRVEQQAAFSLAGVELSKNVQAVHSDDA